MPIKEKELDECRPTIRYMDSTNITLENFGAWLGEKAQMYGAPVSLAYDTVSRGLFGGGAPCLVLYHPQHPHDYFRFCILISYQGSIALVSTYLCGRSTQMKKEAISQAKTGAGWAALFGGAVGIGYAVGSGVRKAVNALGKSKSKLEEERTWYGAIHGILDEVIC